MFEANPTIRRRSNESITGDTLTFNGVIHRTGALLLATGITFALTWRGLESGELPVGAGLVGTIVGLVLALVIIFTRATNPLLIGSYAVAQGLALGTISYLANQKFPGIAFQAVTGTGACFSIVLWLYSMKVLRATPVFVKVITAAMLGIMALYLVDLVAGLFGTELGLIRGSSAMAIGISAVIVVVASLCFVIDFAAIEESIEQGADAKQGWHFAFSLLMGLVWLYLSILRLLTNLRGRD
jgi:uncharacterized YccA/Bax inhibitor family protein